MNLLAFAQKTTPPSPPPGPKNPPTQPITTPEPDWPFEPNQHYTLTGQDIYQAIITPRGNMVLKDLNKSWSTPYVNVVYGYFIQDNKIHFGELAYGYKTYAWQIPLEPTGLSPASFTPCQVQTKIIDFKTW